MLNQYHIESILDVSIAKDGWATYHAVSLVDYLGHVRYIAGADFWVPLQSMCYVTGLEDEDVASILCSLAAAGLVEVRDSNGFRARATVECEVEALLLQGAKEDLEISVLREDSRRHKKRAARLSKRGKR